MEPRIDIRHLRAFVAVAEAGSLSAGARRRLSRVS